MKKVSLIIVVAIVGCALSAQASVFTAGLSYDGLADTIQDNSVALAIRDSGPGGVADGILGPGDVVSGILRWNIRDDGGLFGATTVGVFALEITNNGVATGPNPNWAGDPGVQFTHGPMNPADPLSLNGLLPAQSAAEGGFAAGTMAVILSNTGGANLTGMPFGNPVTPGTALFDLATAGWTVDASMGLLAADDFFLGTFRDTTANAFTAPADAIITISDTDGDGWADEYDALNGAGPGAYVSGPTTRTGFEDAAFSVMINHLGSPLLKVPTAQGGWADFVIYSELLQANQTQINNGYQFSDQAYLTLNTPLPEPTSLVIWGLLGAGCAGGAMVRRKRRAPWSSETRQKIHDIIDHGRTSV
ncbi:MAG: hypothetical protein JXM70_16830 [Pirellulales bacterium]|nr:hypothetical protein [Pirellulales bacterium]